MKEKRVTCELNVKFWVINAGICYDFLFRVMCNAVVNEGKEAPKTCDGQAIVFYVQFGLECLPSRTR